MANIQIRHEGGCGHIEVDGVPLKGVVEANVKLEPRSLPVVEVRLIATESGMDFKDGVLKVGALHAPEALERALLAHLKAKYESDLLRLPVVNMGMDKASGPDREVRATTESIRRSIADWFKVPAPEGDALHVNIAAPAGLYGNGALTVQDVMAGLDDVGGNGPGPTEPTAEDPMEAIRALVKKHGGGSGG